LTSKVIILGGGVAGMSAAQELAERGFQVEVFERRDMPGGKARSLPVTDASDWRGTPGLGGVRKPWLPGEHGFRFFPGFYRHVVDTMRRIPFRGRTVADNLVDTTQIQIARIGRPSVSLPARFPLAPGEVQTALYFVLGLLGGELGLDVAETAFLATKVWQIFSSCEERRMTEYEGISWWKFIEAEQRSPAYQSVFGHAITRSLVAAKARRASTKTIGNIFTQMLLYIIQPGQTSDRLLNGPTNDVWIEPWLCHLRSMGVVYNLDAEVLAINARGGQITSVTVGRGGRTFEVRGDYFVGALPVERMADLVTPALAAADPALAAVPALSQDVEWMNGIQFYLTKDVPLTHGHTIFLGSPWALTSVSQAQFWSDYDFPSHGDGRVRGILSVDISSWTTPGLNGKVATECTREEIAREVWNQVKQSINVGGVTLLDDEHLHFWFLDPDIQAGDPSMPGHETNLEPLLVNYTDTWRLRPEAVTRIPNFFLASDYVRTHTDLATMEGANEAARRATNGIIAAAGSSAKPCEIWKLHEPEFLLPLRAYDEQRFRRGLPWDPGVVQLGQYALGLAASASSVGGAPNAGTAGAERVSELVGRVTRDLKELTTFASAPGAVEPPVGSPSFRPTRPDTLGMTEVPRGPSSSPRIRILPE
jgi:uncharacterized protein with NAD-binding domain and iron-sulfur cluster